MDPTTDQNAIDHLYVVCQDVLVYFKCLGKLQPIENSNLLTKVKESLLAVIQHSDSAQLTKQDSDALLRSYLRLVRLLPVCGSLLLSLGNS